MKGSRFSETQTVAILNEADAGLPVKDICHKHGISDATYYNWKSRCGGMDASDLKRIKELEAENAKLKRKGVDVPVDLLTRHRKNPFLLAAFAGVEVALDPVLQEWVDDGHVALGAALQGKDFGDSCAGHADRHSQPTLDGGDGEVKEKLT